MNPMLRNCILFALMSIFLIVASGLVFIEDNLLLRGVSFHLDKGCDEFVHILLSHTQRHHMKELELK